MTACAFCRGTLPASVTVRHGRFCSKKCRQAAFRLRRLEAVQLDHDEPKRLAYADPPYPGLAHYYRDQPTYAGEVDHRELVERLSSGAYDGWALSTSERGLRVVLPLLPEEAHVCPVVKPIGVPAATRGLHTTWEALIVVPARRTGPGLRDWLAAAPARGGGELIGRKSLRFCAFLFRALGARPGDELDDLYPGTGIVGRAWSLLSQEGAAARALRGELDKIEGVAPMDGADAT